MNNVPIPILNCYILEGIGSPQIHTIDPSFYFLGKLLAGEFNTLDVRKMFYDLLKTVQDSSDLKIEKEWRGNAMGYIVKKDNITIISDDCEELLTVPIPLFLQALHEWEEYLEKNFPQYTNQEGGK